MDYMNDYMDEKLVRLYFEIQAQDGVASSRRPRHQRRNIERNCEEGHDRLMHNRRSLPTISFIRMWSFSLWSFCIIALACGHLLDCETSYNFISQAFTSCLKMDINKMVDYDL
jgi:hypothetical protein